MSTSTDGLLVYGYDIGGEDGEFAFEDPTPAWLAEDDEDDDVAEQFAVALRRANGFTETYEDGREGYFDRKREADAALGVEIAVHCSSEYSMYFLAAFRLRAARGYPEPLDMAELQRRAVEENWDARLANACRLLGLTPTGKPGWYLASYWG